MNKNQVIHRKTCQWNWTKGDRYYVGRVYKSKEASFIPGSVQKTLVFLIESYDWKVALNKFHSVCSDCDLSPNTRAEILLSFYKFWPWNKHKGLVFSVIRLEGEVNFFVRNFLQTLFSSTAVVKKKIMKENLWEVSLLILCFQSFKNITQFLFKPCAGNETCLKKSTEVST